MQRKTAALVRNVGAVVCWSVAPLMIRATREHYTVLFQTFVRYLASLAVLWPVVRVSRGREGARRDLLAILPLLPRICLIAVVNYSFQVTYTVAYYTLLPGFGSLVSQTGVIFAVVLAVVFFADERTTLRRPAFLLGLLAAVVGVLVTVLAGRGSPTGSAEAAGSGSLWLGVLAMLGSAFSWSLLGTLVKKWLSGVNPLFALSAVFTIVTPLFLLTDVVASGGFHLPAAPLGVWAVVVLSGLVGVGLGHSLYYSAIPVTGVTVSASLGLLVPLIAGVLSALLFGERLGAAQLAGGVLLIGGCFVVIRERFRSPGGSASSS
jgi:drug/metabolite transporter (DMT)-like permease